MEELKYIIEDKTIAELLGVQNFTNKESAVLELVKNSYDAGSTEVVITFDEGLMVIKDNGKGMNSSDIKDNWMHVGKSNKEYEFLDANNEKRILAGSKGIGRFALSRLGENVKVYTKKENDECVVWFTDWNRSNIENCNFLVNSGTTIIIEELRDKWTAKSVDQLTKFLSRTYNDGLMKIKIIFQNERTEVKRYFKEPKLGYNCLSYFNLNYSAAEMHLKYEIWSDEFDSDAKKCCNGEDLSYHEGIVSIFDEFDGRDEFDANSEDLTIILKQLGDFSAQMYYSLNGVTSTEIEKFGYKYKSLDSRYDNGVVLYRNAFSISSYEGKKDWLGLGKRSRKSPAAASHPTGSWRVRENQLAGKVIIDKKENSYLSDLSNRQGLNENIHYDIFISILDTGLTEFERYRQKIIRKICNSVGTKEVNKSTISDKIVENPKQITTLTALEVDKFIGEIKSFKKESAIFKKEIDRTEERYKYDVRMLNMLSTLGLRATSIAHEMRNDRNSISDNCDSIEAALREFGVWDLINLTKNKKYAYKNIPELLSKNKKVNNKMIAFMDTMLSDVEKAQFEAKNLNISSTINSVKTTWEHDYSWINIRCSINGDLEFFMAEDIIKVILDNLILNSIQQNDEKNRLDIKIEVIEVDEKLHFNYKDNGKGLSKKYKLNPRKILEVHETSRKKGHGLGMWIVNNTVTMTGGEITAVLDNAGFGIRFTLGDKI